MEKDRIIKLVLGLLSLMSLSISLFVDDIGILFIIGAIMFAVLNQIIDSIIVKEYVFEGQVAKETKYVLPDKVEPKPIAPPPKPPEEKPIAKPPEPKQVLKCKECGKQLKKRRS